MLNKEKVVDFLRRALVFKQPEVEKDEAFKYTDDQLWEVVELVIPMHNPIYSIETFPENELYFAIQLAKKEVYYRLATSTAPFYPLTAEGASLRKDYRFEHYMSLIRRVEQDYSTTWKRFMENGGTVEVSSLVTKRKHYTPQNYANANVPTVAVSIDRTTEELVEFSWTKFRVQGGIFHKYELYLSKEDVYDEYEADDKQFSKDYLQKVEVIDIHRTKYRFKGLTANETYKVTVVSYDTNRLKGVDVIEFTATTP